MYAYARDIQDEPDKNEQIEEEQAIEHDMLAMKVEAIEEDPVVSFLPPNYQENLNEEFEEKPNVKKHCNVCNLFFKPKNYYQHKIRHHRVGFEFKCDIDGKIFRLKNDLREHMKTHENRASRQRFFCPTCKNPFLSMTALRNHVNFFHSEYIEEHPCLNCGKIFPSRMKMQQHTKTVHEAGSYLCEECNKIYATPASLKKHFLKNHTGKIPCTECGKLFAKGSLKQHMKIHNAPEFACTFENCDKKFHTNSSLKNHEESHQAGIPLQCPDCNAKFPTSRHLFRHHKRQHTAVRVQCEVANCFHSTTRKDYLVQHYKTHKELDEHTRQMLIERAKDMKEIGW